MLRGFHFDLKVQVFVSLGCLFFSGVFLFVVCLLWLFFVLVEDIQSFAFLPVLSQLEKSLERARHELQRKCSCILYNCQKLTFYLTGAFDYAD